LRARYEDNQAVSKSPGAYSAEYLADNSDLIASFYKDHEKDNSHFVRDLAQVDTPFNPIRAYLSGKRPKGR